MAKERTNTLDVSDDKVVKRKKMKSRVKKDERGKGRASFCPNKSKSFNSSNRSYRGHHVSTTALKKNNEELAKSLNKCKGVIAHLQTEKLELESKLMELRAERPQFDDAAVEAEVQRRLVATLFPVKKQITQAIDNMVGLSDNLTQSLQLVSAPLRMSTQSSSGGRGSNVGPNRGSSIGMGANFRMRPIINFPTRESSSAGNSSQSKSSPPKQLSKVSPMVAGHAISRPRIQLTRMDIEAMSAAREQLGQENEVESNEELNEGIDGQIGIEGIDDQIGEGSEVDMVQMEPLPHPGRSLFNLTNIGEENSVLLADESRIEESILEEDENSTEQLDHMEMLEEERDSTPDISIRRRSRSSYRESSDFRRITRGSPEDLSQARRSGLASLATPRIVVQPDSLPQAPTESSTTTTPQGRLSRPPLRQISAPSSSPKVDILNTQRHPAIVIPDLVQMNHPDLPSRYSQPSSTPLLPPTPPPANKRTSAPVFTDFPENPSESFLEQMIDSDPMEGPSWLFAPSTKKRRSSVARRLSAVLSDSERGSSRSTATMNCTSKATLSLNSSDIDVSNTGDGLSSAEVSGYVLDRDLLETAVMLPSHDASIDKSGPVVDDGARVTSDDDMMDLTRPAESQVTDQRLNSSNQENAPVELVEHSGIYESNISISVSNTPRTPLSSLTYTDSSGEVVKFNPRTDTGVTVARLREARILLDNVGMGDEGATTPYKLSECYIDLSPGRSMSLDQLFSLGLRAGIASPNESPKVMKRKHVSEMTNAVTPSKKRRMTDMPSYRQRGVRASLDMIPAPHVVAAAKKGSMTDFSKPTELPNVLNVNEGLVASNDVDKIPRSGSEIIYDALTGGSSSDDNVDNDKVPEPTEIVQRKSVEVESVKKMSMIPSFVRLEKSPVKLIGRKRDPTINYESIDSIHCVGGKGKESMNEDVDQIVEVPEPERRRRTKVDYAAMLNDSIEDGGKCKTSEVVDAQSKPSRKSKAVKNVVNKKSCGPAVLTGKSSGLNDDFSDVNGIVNPDSKLTQKRSVEEVPNPEVQSDEEPESMPSSSCLEPSKSPRKVGLGSVEVVEGGLEEARNVSIFPTTVDESSTSRGSQGGAVASSRASSLEVEDAPEGRGGRSRRGNVVSYKEPPLGKKLRQGDAGSISLYKDFRPAAKSKKSRKK